MPPSDSTGTKDPRARLNELLQAHSDSASFSPSVNVFQFAIGAWVELVISTTAQQHPATRSSPRKSDTVRRMNGEVGFVPPALVGMIAGMLRRPIEEAVLESVLSHPSSIPLPLVHVPDEWADTFWNARHWGPLVQGSCTEQLRDILVGGTGLTTKRLPLGLLLAAAGEVSALRTIYKDIVAHLRYLDGELWEDYNAHIHCLLFVAAHAMIGPSVAAGLMELPAGHLQPRVVAALETVVCGIMDKKAKIFALVDAEAYYEDRGDDDDSWMYGGEYPVALPVVARLEKHAKLTAADPARAAWLCDSFGKSRNYRDAPSNKEPRPVAWARQADHFGVGDVRAIVYRHAARHNRDHMNGLLETLSAAVGHSSERLDVTVGALSQELGLVEEAVALAAVCGVPSKRWSPRELISMLQQAEWRVYGPKCSLEDANDFAWKLVMNRATPAAEAFCNDDGSPWLRRKTPATTWLGRPHPHVMLHHLPGTSKQPWAVPTEAAAPATVGRDEYVERWDGIVGDLLPDDFPHWDVMWATGGTVVRCLDPEPLPDTAPATLVAAEVDVFFVARAEEDIKQYVAALARHLTERAGATEVLALPTAEGNSVTFVILDVTKPRIRVDLGLWGSVGEYLATVDVDCCCVAYQPPVRQVLLSARGCYAWAHRLNVALPERAEPRGSQRAYRMRLWKYAARHGIAVLNPNDSGADRRLWERGHQVTTSTPSCVLGKRQRQPSGGGNTGGDVAEKDVEGLAWLLAVEEGRIVPGVNDEMRNYTVADEIPLDRLERDVQVYRPVPFDDISADELTHKRLLYRPVPQAPWSLDSLGERGSTDIRAAFVRVPDRLQKKGHRTEAEDDAGRPSSS